MQTTHITGPAGCGKTQILTLIASAYPQAICLSGGSTAAGVAQMLKQHQSPDTLIIVDEANDQIIRMLESAQHPGRAIVAHYSAHEASRTLSQIWRDFLGWLRG